MATATERKGHRHRHRHRRSAERAEGRGGGERTSSSSVPPDIWLCAQPLNWSGCAATTGTATPSIPTPSSEACMAAAMALPAGAENGTKLRCAAGSCVLSCACGSLMLSGGPPEMSAKLPSVSRSKPAMTRRAGMNS